MVPTFTSQSIVYNPPNIALLIGSRMDETNYPTWLFQCRPILQSHELLGFMERTELCPTKFLIVVDDKESTDLNP
jgi:hypothetical protein